jgi:hypothetical protein
MQYDIVIWFTARQWGTYPSLTNTDTTNLSTYLNAGGNLFLSSQDYLYDFYGAGSFTASPGEFAYDYLKIASGTSDTGVGTIYGVQDDPITDGITYTTVDRFTDYSDRITPLGSANTILTTTTGNNSLRYAGSYKVVFMAMPFEFISNEANRSELMGRIIRWFYNTEPTPPTTILPDNTPDKTPHIYWLGAHDNEGDVLKYYIRIGNTPWGAEIINWTFTNTNAYYDIINALPIGTYYVQVRANDGMYNSTIRQETLVIENTPPNPPTWILPDTTGDRKPKITWGGASDADGDLLRYYIRIGKTSGGGEVLAWTYVGTDTFYQVITSLQVGKYYIQIKAFDGFVNSTVHEETMHVLSIVINEICTFGDANNEWIEIYNNDVNALDITSWRLTDNDGNVFTFPSFVIPPGGYVVVHVGLGIDNSTDLYWNRITAVFEDYGDNVILYNSLGQPIDYVAYGTCIEPAPPGTYWGPEGSEGIPEAPLFGESLSRIPNGEDNDWYSDWQITNGSCMTPGAPNIAIPEFEPLIPIFACMAIPSLFLFRKRYKLRQCSTLKNDK